MMALPSPFDQQLLVVVNVPEPIANQMGIKITDMMGRVMYTKKQTRRPEYYSTSVSTIGWTAGIYEVTLYNNNRRIYERKVKVEEITGYLFEIQHRTTYPPFAHSL